MSKDRGGFFLDDDDPVRPTRRPEPTRRAEPAAPSFEPDVPGQPEPAVERTPEDRPDLSAYASGYGEDIWEKDPRLNAWLGQLRSDLAQQFPEKDADEVRRIAVIRDRFEALNGERSAQGIPQLTAEHRELLISHIVSFGALTPHLRNEKITEIQVNGDLGIFVTLPGRQRVKTDDELTEKQRLDLAGRLLANCRRNNVSESEPFVDGFLADRTRIHVAHASVTTQGTVITIRKHGAVRLSLTDLASLGSMPIECVRFLEMCVRGRANILISGGTDSGKTTLLNAMANVIPPHERVIVIEDAVELQIDLPNLIGMHTKPGNLEGKNEVAIRRLVKESLRMSPSRIIVGETRSSEALDVLQAMNTGHSGSLTTNHADSAIEALDRLEVACFLGAGENFPTKAVRRQIASGVNLVIYVAALPNGKRRVVDISELNHINEDDQWVTTKLWQMDPSDPTSKLVPVGRLSEKLESRFQGNGVNLQALRDLLRGQA